MAQNLTVEQEEQQVNITRCDWSTHDHTDLQEARECFRETFMDEAHQLEARTWGDQRVVPESDPTGWWEQCACLRLFIQTDGAPDANTRCGECIDEARAARFAQAEQDAEMAARLAVYA